MVSRGEGQLVGQLEEHQRPVQLQSGILVSSACAPPSALQPLGSHFLLFGVPGPREPRVQQLPTPGSERAPRGARLLPQCQGLCGWAMSTHREACPHTCPHSGFVCRQLPRFSLR